ncbi:MAG: gliding motility-associated C-terminal domain-containing protein [Bacteroidales bacterium]|nr:gliding motility-associated C-terminal domain-containing protein [Bacteroidales bacterium]
MIYTANPTYRSNQRKSWLTTLLLAICPLLLNAQNTTQINLDASTNGTTYPIQSTGVLLNSATVNGYYEAGTDYSITLSSSCTHPLRISVVFDGFDVAPSDSLLIYDGANINAPLLICCNNQLNTPGRITLYASPSNSSGCLTVRFITHSSLGRGFQLFVLCRIPCETIVPVIDDVYYKMRGGRVVDTCHLETHYIIDTIHHAGQPDTYDTSSYRAAKVCLGEQVRLQGHGNYNHYYNVYTPRDSSTIFRWNFGNGDTLTRRNGTQATTTYTALDCYIVTLELTDTIGCLSYAREDIRIHTSANPLRTIHPLSAICNNDTALFSIGYSPTSHIMLSSIFTTAASRTNNVKTFIPDGPNCPVQCYSAPVTFVEFPNNRTITSADDICSICINYEHEYMGDYELSIICPTNQRAVIKYKDSGIGHAEYGMSGGGGTYTGMPYGGNDHHDFDGNFGYECDSLYNPAGIGLDYCFTRNEDDYSYIGGTRSNSYLACNGLDTSVTVTFPAPPAGYMSGRVNTQSFDTRAPSHHSQRSHYYAPADDLSQLIGCPLNGTWSIEICDTWSSDNGWVFNWTLDICGITYNDEEIACTYQVDIDTILLQYDSITAGHRNPGVDISIIDSGAFHLSTPGISGRFPLVAYVIDNFGCVWDTTVTLISYPATRDTLNVTSCVSYRWNNTTYTRSGQYSHTFTSSHGCDSVVVLNLTIRDSVVNVLPAESYCYSYTWHRITANQPGSHRLRYVTLGSSGCDSIVYLPLTIKDSAVIILPAENHCYSYTWNGQTRNSSGTYRLRDSRTAANGCDSITYLPLTISDSAVITLPPLSYCYSYTWNSMSRTSPGTYQLRYPTVSRYNCDSITYLTLTIKDSSVRTLAPEAHCYAYTWNNQNRTTPGTYNLRDNRTAANGCDSITYLTITINDSSVTHLPPETYCYTHTWNGHTSNIIGDTTLRHISTNIHTCDSIIYLPVTIKDSVVRTLTPEEYCYTHTWNGQTRNTPGTYLLREGDTAANGCDSITYLSLTIHDSTRSDSIGVYCDRYRWHGVDYLTSAASGTKNYHTYGIYGCDSTAYLHLTIHDSTREDITSTYCDSYTWHGTTYRTSDSSGTKTYHTQNQWGCDSTVYLHLTINDSSRSDSTGVYCDRYEWHGQIFLTSRATGPHTHLLTNAKGCDSIMYLHLTIHDSTRSDSIGVYCDRYRWHGVDYLTSSASGTKTFSTHNANGCDSISYLHLTIHDSTRFDSTGIHCDAYTWHGVTYRTNSESGTYTYHTHNIYGCDSTVYMHLTIYDSSVAFVPHTDICYSYTWNGMTVNDIGFHNMRYVTTNQHNCDSIVYTTVNIKDSSVSHVHDTTIENRLPWRFNGTYVTHATEDTIFNYTNAVGCDSLLHYHLFVYHNIIQNYDSTICDNQLPLTWMGRLYTQASSTSVTLHASHGEDSTVNQTLIVHPTSTSIMNDTIVENQLPWNFNGHIYNENVTNEPVIIDNMWQCDSTITYSLHIYRNYLTRYDDDICDDQLPYTWMGHAFTSADSIANTYTAQHGEDSSIVQVLRVRHTSNSYVTDTIVQNQLPWYYNSTRFGGAIDDYVFHRINTVGCDSSIHYTLFVYRNVSSTTLRYICDNEFPYTWNGVVFNETGTQSTTLRTVHGADSIVLMILRTKPTYHDSIFAETCNGNSYGYNGNYYGTPGTYPVTLTAANDCDSVVDLHLTVHPSYIHNVNPIICDDSCYTHDGHIYTQPGTYRLRYPTIHGCDSTISICLRVRPTYDNHVELVFCHGASIEYNDSIYTERGLHTFAMTSMDGCDSVEHLYLYEEPLPIPNISLEPEYASYDQLDIRIRDNSRNSLAREWYIDDEYAGNDEVVYYLFPRERDTIPVRLIVTGPMGCIDSTKVLIPFRKHIIWTPNVFTPKRTDNNRFCVAGDDLTTAEVSIYTRTGNLVCTFDAMTNCWDGTKNGVPCLQGSYIYTVRFTSKSDPKNPQIKTGTVTLLY